VVLDAAKTGVNASDIQQLVGNAVGLDAARGDSVQVSSVAFDTTAAKAAAKQLSEAQSAARTASYLDLGKKGALGLAVLVLLFVAWRRRSAGGATRVSALAADLPAEGTVLGALPGSGLPALGAGPEAAPENDNHERRERMRTELSAFVDSQPDEIAQLVQGWLAERKG
jgi:flagellar M-ring protein FliF